MLLLRHVPSIFQDYAFLKCSLNFLALLLANMLYSILGLPWWLSSKESAYNAADLGLIPGLQRFPGEGHGYSSIPACLENPMDRGTWRATVHEVAELDMTEATLHTHARRVH